MTHPSTSVFGAGFADLTPAGTVSARQVALVPGAMVPVITLDLPAGLRGEDRELVARRQVLDRMGLDEATVEIRPFYAGKDSEAWTRVLLADSASLSEWRKQASACRAVLPDYLALPAADDVWSYCATPGGVAVRLGPQDGFSASLDVACAMLTRKPDTTPPRAVIRVGAPVPQIEALFAAKNIRVTTDLAGAKVLGHGEATFDLRRDPRQARVRLRRQVLPWRWPVLIGGAAAAIWAAALITETRQTEARTETLRAQTHDLVRTHFVPNGPLPDIRSQVSRAIVERRVAAGPSAGDATSLSLFARASQVISDLSAAPEAITASKKGTVTLVLRVADFAAADQLADALRAEGLGVEVIESRVSDNNSGVRTELLVTETAS